jgi:hypothetical protein
MMLVLTVLLVGSFLIHSAPLVTNPGGVTAVVSRQSSAEVTKIQNYHDQIDRWAKSHPNAVRYFSTVVQDDNSSPWKAFPNKRSLPPLETHASVWIKDGQVVATIISFKSDHTESTDGSYFRADGTLAIARSTSTRSVWIRRFREASLITTPAGRYCVPTAGVRWTIKSENHAVRRKPKTLPLVIPTRCS